MSNVLIAIKGLAIKKPKANGLNLDFLYEDVSSCPHKLKLSGDNVPNGEISIPQTSNQIDITTHNATPIKPKYVNRLDRHILKLNEIHGEDLKNVVSEDVSSINLNSPNAMPHSLLPTKLHKVYWKTSGWEEGVFSFTHVIGISFKLLPEDGSVTVAIKNITPIVLNYSLNKDYVLTFDNTCNKLLHNDFKLYYEVLKANDNRELRIMNPDYPSHTGIDTNDDSYKFLSDLIACNPVEGGGGS